VDLQSYSARATLVSEVWGKESLRRQGKRLARSAGAGAGAGAIFDGCSACDAGAGAGEALLAVLVIAVAAILVVGFVWALYRLGRYLKQRADDARPCGAYRSPRPMDGRSRVGRVRAVAENGRTLPESVRYLASKVFSGLPTMLIEGHSPGFEVELDGGEVVHVPAGPMHLSGRDEEKIEDIEPLRARIAELDPHGTLDGARIPQDPFVFDSAKAVRLRVGDRVELFNPLEVAADQPDGEAAYRENARVIVPQGVPVLRKLRPDKGARIPT
jgi:hypothetical protein